MKHIDDSPVTLPVRHVPTLFRKIPYRIADADGRVVAGIKPFQTIGAAKSYATALNARSL